MINPSKFCKVHGKLKPQDTNINTNGKRRINCKICDRENSKTLRFKKAEKRYNFVGPIKFILTCKIHGKLLHEQIKCSAYGGLRCKQCCNERSKIRRLLPNPELFVERKCVRCRKIKQKSEFQPYDFKLRSPYCSICRSENNTSWATKNRNHLKKYDLTPNKYDLIYAAQNGLCFICKLPERSKLTSRSKKPKETVRRLSVDHCHKLESKGIKNHRALLCQLCNLTIGTANDSPELLRAMADYLDHHNKLNEHYFNID